MTNGLPSCPQAALRLRARFVVTRSASALYLRFVFGNGGLPPLGDLRLTSDFARNSLSQWPNFKTLRQLRLLVCLQHRTVSKPGPSSRINLACPPQEEELREVTGHRSARCGAIHSHGETPFFHENISVSQTHLVIRSPEPTAR